MGKQLPNNVKTHVTFTGQKLSPQFNIKNMTKFQHKHVIYFGKCQEKNGSDDYHGESARRTNYISWW